MTRGKLSILAWLIASATLTQATAAEDSTSPLELPVSVIQSDRRAAILSDWLEARDRGANELRSMISSGSPLALDYDTPALRHSALTFLDPIPEAFIQLSDLKKHVDPPISIIKTYERLIFPVLINRTVYSSITVSKVNGQWEPVAFGPAPVIRQAMRARLRMVKEVDPHTRKALINRPGRINQKLVRVTGLNLMFLAADGPTGLHLVPLVSDQRFKFQAGVPILATTVLTQLAVLAKQIKPAGPT